MNACSSRENVPVVLVDDQASLRQMLSLILQMDGAYKVVGQARGGLEGLRLCRATKPRVLILDLSLPELSGLQLIRLLRAEDHDTRIVVYTAATDEDTLRQAIELEPDAFVRKEDDLEDLQRSLNAVRGGGTYYSHGARRLLRSARERNLSRLSTQETAVLQMIAEGRQSKEIAEVLCAAVKTVDHHRQNLMNKLGIHDIASLTRYAIRMRLLPVG